MTSTRELLAASGADPGSIRCLALSGQSIAVVPIDKTGALLREFVPIWSDTRPVKQRQQFFETIDYDRWYMTTGNGFASDTYSVFKIMWCRDNEPGMFEQVERIVGSKDYINFRLTGEIATDHSYASGSGVYNLIERRFEADFLGASGLTADVFPPVVEANASLGHLSADAADELGLPQSVEVFCGGVDNACMALGAGNIREGAIYLSLGSSAWFAVSSSKPVVDLTIKPFVFAHVIPKMYTSATSIFAAGSAVRWLRDTVFPHYNADADRTGRDAYDLMVEAALQSPIGANRLFFNPSLAGGPAAYPNPDIRGAFLGLDLRHTENDLIRAVLEGIALDLKIMYTKLAQLVELEDDILMVGGGSNNSAWMQMFADVFDLPFFKANVGQDAASLGAATVAAVGAGIWDDYRMVDSIIQHQSTTKPDPANVETYRRLSAICEQTWQHLSGIAELMKQI